MVDKSEIDCRSSKKYRTDQRPAMEYSTDYQEYQSELKQNQRDRPDDYNSNSNGDVKNEFDCHLNDGDSNENSDHQINADARNYPTYNNGTEADLFTNSIKAELEQQRQLGAFDQYNENTNTNDAEEDGSRYSKDELRDMEKVQIKDERREHSRSGSKEASRDRERRRSRSKERRRKDRERSSKERTSRDRERDRSSDRSSKDRRKRDDKVREKRRSRSRSAGRRRRDDSRDRVRSRNRSRERRDRSPRKLAKRRRPSKYWDIAPVGFEHVTPIQYKAMQAAGQIPATLFVPSSAPAPVPAVTGASSSAPIGSTITRQARRLYIGNIPFGCTEEEMMEFFNSQMRSCNFVQATGNSVLAVQINLDKNFAFLEVSRRADSFALWTNRLKNQSNHPTVSIDR